MVHQLLHRLNVRFRSATFWRYLCVGVGNTLVHWSIFFLLTVGAHQHQARANLIAFLCAVTVSFFANARWTFSKTASPTRFVRYILFMACLSLVTGWAGERLSLAPFLTVGLFSALSLVVGYLYAHHVVFRDKQA